MAGLIAQFATTPQSAQPGPQRVRRSKGCQTCRKRKVKCGPGLTDEIESDEARPICERCRSGFHSCLGYDEPRIFVNLRPRTVGKKVQPSARSRATSVQAVSSARLSPGDSGDSTQQGSQWPAVVSGPQRSQYFSNSFSAVDGRLPPTLDLGAFRDNIVISHLLLKFPAIVDDNSSVSSDAPTLTSVLLAGETQSTAYVSGLSVAEALFGRTHFDTNLVRHSATLYGQGLKRLQTDLQNMGKAEVRRRSYMNLWSSTFLGMYEIIAASKPMNWLEHSRGLSALTRSLGPRAFQGASARRLFYSNRLFIVTACIARNERTFLEEYDWKVVPWADLEPLPKPVAILLQDIFCDIPGFMEDAKRLMLFAGTRRESHIHELNMLQNNIIDAYMNVALLRRRWETEFPNVCWEVPTLSALKGAEGVCSSCPFDTMLHFTHFDRAIDAIYFNVIRLLLCELAEEIGMTTKALLKTRCATSPITSMGPFSNAMHPPDQGTADDFALEICRTVQYLTQGNSDSLGAMVLMFPLRLASQQLRQVPEVVEWLSWVLTKLTTRKGFALGEHVMGIKSAA